MLCFQTKSLESANLFCDIPGEKLLLRESILNMKLKNYLLVLYYRECVVQRSLFYTILVLSAYI